MRCQAHCKTVLECIKTKGIGAKRFWDIYQTCNQDIYDMKHWISTHGFAVPNVDAILEQHEKAHVHMLCFCQNEYPKALRDIPNAPPILFYRGNIGLLNNRLIGIVGARNASFGGKKLAFQIANALCDRDGFTIVSGLAKGIDTHAHKGSVDFGCIAVIAQGLDVFYPKENEKLYIEIIDKGGLLLSELEMGVQPNAFSFPVRNRMIAGMVEGLVVIEAAFQSGTLSTARLGLEFNKEIFVAPGSPFDPRYKGSHQLIKDGAFLIEDASDITQHLEMTIKHEKTPQKIVQQELPIQDTLFENMGMHDPMTLEDLCVHLNVSAKTLISYLMTLEIQGKIKKQNDGRYMRIE